LLELLAACGGMPELLAPWEVTLICMILTAGQSLPPVYYPVRWVGLPECWLPADCERDEPSGERPVLKASFDGIIHSFYCRFVVVYISPTRTWNLRSHHP
jgi:hypothetical protein